MMSTYLHDVWELQVVRINLKATQEKTNVKVGVKSGKIFGQKINLKATQETKKSQTFQQKYRSLKGCVVTSDNKSHPLKLFINKIESVTEEYCSN